MSAYVYTVLYVYIELFLLYIDYFDVHYMIL